MSNAHSPFRNAWVFLKELDTQDFRQAARTGGIGMTPERRQAYTDAGLPLNTGGGFRTMPETEAAGMMGFQRGGDSGGYNPNTGIKDWWNVKEGPVPIPRTDADFKDVKINPATGQYSDSDGRISPEDQYAALHGGSMEDPSLEQEPEPIGRFVDKIVPSKYFSHTKRVPQISNAPKPYKEYLDNLQEENRNKETALPEGHQGPEEFPTSEFARRGDASASPTDQAFEVIQQRREAAEAHERVLADRQREMQMNAMRARMQSQPTMQRQQRGRRGQGPNSRRNRMKQNR